MAGVEWVDGAGWISDESSFYGDDEVKSDLEQSCHRSVKRVYDNPELHVSRKKAKPVPLVTPKSEPALPPQSSPLFQRKKANSNATANMMSTHDPNLEYDDDEEDVNFLKSRPQLAALQSSNASNAATPDKQPARTLAGEEASDLVDNPRHGKRGISIAWHKDETIDTFLHRHVVNDPATQTGPDGWLWVDCPTIPRAHASRLANHNESIFTIRGEAFLEEYMKQHTAMVSQYGKIGSATMNRKMGPYRDQLESDLLAAATANGITSGKWMFFPSPSDLARYWRIVATATAEGKLGPTTKSAVVHPGKHDTLICVYTYDFSDVADVRRVLEGLVELGLVSEDRKPIYYKCDAYTYLDIGSKNDYNLRASLYNSRDVLGKHFKTSGYGAVGKATS